MADEQEVHPEHVRKTITMTHRQGGYLLTIITTLFGFSHARDIREAVWDHGEVKVQSAAIEEFKEITNKQLDKIQAMIAQQDLDHTHKLERLADKIVDRIKDSETRTTKNEDRIEKRVENLELFAFKIHSKNNY